MSLEDWNGVEIFMNGGQNPDEWLHFVASDRLQATEDHRERLSELEDYRKAYMLVYGENDFDLVNPDTKYNARGEKTGYEKR